MFCAATMAEYRFALDFLALSEKTSSLDTVFNDAVPESGLPSGTYDVYKLRFLNTLLGTEFALLSAVRAALTRESDWPHGSPLIAAMDEDEAALWAHGFEDGPVLTAKNALATLRKAALSTWFPVRKRFSLLLSHLRLPVRDRWLITRRKASNVRAS